MVQLLANPALAPLPDSQTVFKASASYRNLTLLLSNEGTGPSTVAVYHKKAGVEYRISASGIVLAVESDPDGGNIVEVTLPGLQPGEEIKVKSTGADSSTRVLVYGEITKR